jgi:hypothetical protein
MGKTPPAQLRAVARLRAKRLAFIRRVALWRGCRRCGYRECFGALDFHHLDPSTKKCPVSRLSTNSIVVIKEEIRKTIILCSNCHRELHLKIWNISDLVLDK